MPNQTLNIRQKAFVREYRKHGNATQAAKDAGYSPKTAYAQGSQLLKHPEIASQIARKDAENEAKSAFTIETWEKEILKLATADPRAFYDDRGRLKPIHELDEATAATIASFEVLDKRVRGRNGKRQAATLSKVKTWSKTEALTLMGRRLGIYQDRMTVAGQISLEVLVNAAIGIKDRQDANHTPLLDITPDDDDSDADER